MTQPASGKIHDKVPIEEPVICVFNKQRQPGVLKFIGETKFSAGVWCGVALREPCGKNDGSVAGVRYFDCDEQHGIFVLPKHVFPLVAEDKSHPDSTSVIKDGECPDKAYEKTSSNGSCNEGRPRSKSDAVISEKNNDSSVFTNSPFKYNVANKSPSLSKINNVTYICSSPVLTENKNFCKKSSPTYSPPVGELDKDTSLSAYLHPDLSPKLEVKQSIKLGSINVANFAAPAVLGKNFNLNKTYLLPAHNNSQTRQNDLTSDEVSASNEGTAPKQKTVLKEKSFSKETSCLKEKSSLRERSGSKESPDNVIGQKLEIQSSNLDDTYVSESDCINGRARSVSKSSCSSIESGSSFGSVKSNKEMSRFSGIKTPRKLPCPTELSKSKLVKISSEKKHKSKVLDKDDSTVVQGKLIPRSASKLVSNDVLTKKTRTKSTSVTPRSVLAVPSSVTKSSVKTKSKSVSHDVRDAQSLARAPLNSSKFATPLAPRISTLPSSRLTSTPICKKTTPGLDKKCKLSSVRSRISSTDSRNFENEERSVLKQSSDVGSKDSSLQAKQFNSLLSAKKESRSDYSRSRHLSTSSKSVSAKPRTLSTSSALKPEYKTVASRSRNLSTPRIAKHETELTISKKKNMSTSSVDAGIIQTSGE